MSDETPQPETWDERVAALWERADEMHEEEVLAAVDELAAERPEGDPEALFERACAHDFAGREEEAVELYRAALGAGLAGEARAQATVQLAGSLRALERAPEALTVLAAAREDDPEEALREVADALTALCLADLGRDREALVLALTALARHAEPYGPAIEAYAAELPPSGPGAPQP